jgi:hypothetical protein
MKVIIERIQECKEGKGRGLTKRRTSEKYGEGIRRKRM